MLTPRKADRVLSSLEDFTEEVKNMRIKSRTKATVKVSVLLRYVNKCHKELSTVNRNVRQCGSKELTDSVTYLRNHLKSIKDSYQMDNWISKEMCLAFCKDAKKTVKSIEDYVENNTSSDKQTNFNASDIEFPDTDTEYCVMELPIVPPMIRATINPKVMERLKLKYGFIGNGDATDYVCIEDQKVLAVSQEYAKSLSTKPAELAQDILDIKNVGSNFEVAMFSETGATTPECKTHVFYWILPATQVNLMREHLQFTETEWGLAL